jgi:FG-GAP-like repeat
MRKEGIWLIGLVGALALGALTFAGRSFLKRDVKPKRTHELALSKDQREYLWTVEHYGLILGRRGLTRIANALEDGDREALLALFADKFEGEVLGQPREVRFEHDSTRVLREQDSGQPSLHLDREGLAKRLLDDRRRFTKLPTVKLALMGLAPLDPKNLDGIWQGTCQLRMFGEIGAGRPGEVVLLLQYRLAKPTEELLSSDGWLLSCAIKQRQIGEAPKFLMREVAALRGIAVKRFHDNWDDPKHIQSDAGAINVCDYNRDGCLDLLITDFSANVMYQGRPDGTFTDVTQQVYLPRPNFLILNAAFADLDGDGWEDLIYGDRILRNNEGRYFTRMWDANLELNPSANVVVADYDRDGKLDLFVTGGSELRAGSWVNGEGGSQSTNRLWKNLGNWKFADVTRTSNASGGDRSTFTGVWFDADNDEWPDLYVINEFGDGVLLVNRRDGTFREQSINHGTRDYGSMGVTAGDYDNDGHIDLYIGQMYSKAGNRVIANLWPGTYSEPVMDKLRSMTTGSQMHHNLGGLKFDRIGPDLQVAAVGWSYGPAMADLNNDGWLDIYATCGFISRSRDDPDG